MIYQESLVDSWKELMLVQLDFFFQSPFFQKEDILQIQKIGKVHLLILLRNQVKFINMHDLKICFKQFQYLNLSFQQF